MRAGILIINQADNVGVALENISAGSTVSLPGNRELIAASEIPFSHKIALRDIATGEPLIKYGETIGRAAVPIKAGEWVHTHNLITEDEH